MLRRSFTHTLRRLAWRDEQRGGVLVLVALFAPVALLFCSFVIDVGNSWWHQRHLQVQADAAALAAAQDMWPCSDSAALADAQRYGGFTYNAQVGGTPASDIHQVVNSQTFYGQASPVDSTVNTNPPCAANMVDVKMTETGLPWIFQAFDVPYINAQARIELKQLTQVVPGTLPVSVNDTSFQSAEAFFINEATHTVLRSVPLKETGVSNGLDQWTSASTPYALTVPTGPTSDVGVRIALSGLKSNLTGNMTTDCGAPAVMCFDSDSSAAQLLDVHGYDSTGAGTPSPTNPVNHGVTLTSGTCSDPYFMAATTSCTDGITAVLDLGNNPKLNCNQTNCVTVTPSLGSTALTCSWDSKTKLTTCVGTVPVTAESFRTSIDLTVAVKGSTSKTVSNAQSTYAGKLDDRSGPIEALSLYADGVSDSSALQQNTTHSVYVNMGLTPSLSVAQPSDPPVVMRFDGVGSQNQSIGCIPIATPSQMNGWEQALATGCDGNPGSPCTTGAACYQINQTQACPDSITPIDCVPVVTGNKTNNVAKALNYRILGNIKPGSGAAACTAPNHWPNYASGDPRIVTVFVTPYGSFGTSGGSTYYPIQYFAAFYVTGWQSNGGGFTNPCQGNGDDPAAAGTMVGHFIHYLQVLNNGSSGSTTCVQNSLNECIAVMTR